MLMTEIIAYKPEEVALRLRVSEETVRREIRLKHLGALLIGKQYRIAPSDLIAYLGEHRYNEWFGLREDLRAAIGSGELEEDEARELAARAVRAIRESNEAKLAVPPTSHNPRATNKQPKTPAKKSVRHPHA